MSNRIDRFGGLHGPLEPDSVRPRGDGTRAGSPAPPPSAAPGHSPVRHDEAVVRICAYIRRRRDEEPEVEEAAVLEELIAVESKGAFGTRADERLRAALREAFVSNDPLRSVFHRLWCATDRPSEER